MHVDIVPNRTSAPTILLRESWREGARVRKRTIANLTNEITLEQGLMLRRVLNGETLVSPKDVFEPITSRAHGHVLAVLTAMRKLGIDSLLHSRRSRERDLVLALIAQRVIKPASKLASTRAWRTTTLASELGLPAGVSEDDAYAAMDYLAAQQPRIEAKLAARHLREGSLVRFDLSSTYVEGEHCELAEFGYSRDRKRGKKQINWGLLTDALGRPIALSLYPGNTADPVALNAVIDNLRDRFKLHAFTLVGDRGMITARHIQAFLENHQTLASPSPAPSASEPPPPAAAALAAVGDSLPSTPNSQQASSEESPTRASNTTPADTQRARIDWITALNGASLRALIATGVIQASLFDETNLFEITHADYPGERLIACRNPILGRKRAHKRTELLNATLANLTKLQARINQGTLTGAAKIGIAVGRTIGKHNMGKHLTLTITDTTLNFEVNHANIDREANTDGIYVIRTSLPETELDAASTVRAYKELSNVERAFRTIKGIDLSVRPIHHRVLERVKAHYLICTLAYYVRWHMEQAWASITFKDEEGNNPNRDPIKPAKRSAKATKKAQSRHLENGEATHSFATLLADLGTIQKTTHRIIASNSTIDMTTTPTPAQQHALDLLQTISV